MAGPGATRAHFINSLPVHPRLRQFMFVFMLLSKIAYSKNIEILSFELNDQTTGKKHFGGGRVLTSIESFRDSGSVSMYMKLADGTAVSFEDMQRTPTCSIHKNLVITVRDEDIKYDDFECSTFSTSRYDAVFTVLKDGSVDGVVPVNGVLLHIKTDLSKHSGMVAESHERDEQVPCGVHADAVADEKIHDSATSGLNGRRRLQDNGPELWTNCYPGDDKPSMFFIGFSLGSTFASHFDGDVEAMTVWVEAMVAEANLIYSNQLNIHLVVRHIEISGVGEKPWDNPGCSLSIYQHFDAYTAAYQSRPSRQGLWNLLDDCYQPGQAIGIAYPRSLCTSRFVGSTINYVGYGTWTTFAHEAGHSHGALHSFEEGQGSTGGIMDYGDGRLDGIYQFNTKYRKEQVCNHITATADSCAPFRAAITVTGSGNAENADVSNAGLITALVLISGLAIVVFVIVKKRRKLLNNYDDNHQTVAASRIRDCESPTPNESAESSNFQDKIHYLKAGSNAAVTGAVGFVSGLIWDSTSGDTSSTNTDKSNNGVSNGNTEKRTKWNPLPFTRSANGVNNETTHKDTGNFKNIRDKFNLQKQPNTSAIQTDQEQKSNKVSFVSGLIWNSKSGDTSSRNTDKSNNGVSSNLNGNTEKRTKSWNPSPFTLSANGENKEKKHKDTGNFKNVRDKFNSQKQSNASVKTNHGKKSNKNHVRPPISNIKPKMPSNVKEKPFYSFAELQKIKQEGRTNVDRSNLEQYLSPAEFEDIFHMSKSQYASLAKWKQHQLKKSANLF